LLDFAHIKERGEKKMKEEEMTGETGEGEGRKR
jgi:hypothetical protein